MQASSSSEPGLLSKLQQLYSENPSTVLATGAAALAGVAAVSYMMSSSRSSGQAKLPFDLNNQSVIIDGKPEHRASHLCKPPDYFEADVPHKDCKTVYQVLESGKRHSNNGQCLGARTGPNKEYQWMFYQEVIDKVKQFGSGLVHKGVTPSNKVHIGIFSTNRPEWTIADFGCQAFSMIPVPLYDTLGLDAVKFILNQCDIESVVCDNAAKAKILLKVKSEIPSFKRIVLIEKIEEELKSEADKAGIDIIGFDDLLDLGKINPKEPNPPKPDDTHTVCYTSGTTGNPKGVVLTHHSFLSMVLNMMTMAAPNFKGNPSDVHLSYLPLAHNFERAVHVMVFVFGGQIGYFSRDIKLLTDDLITLKPTLFPTVPRLLNRLYDAVYAEVRNSTIKSTMLKWALASKQKDVEKYIYRKNSFWDKILFSKIQNRLGGRVRIVITGSAPISSEVMSFLRCSLGCLVIEGYGQTEATAGITMTVPGDPSVGHVGPPLPGCHIKLVDVPEMDYYAKDNYGEVCAKCDFMLKEYYKEPEKTAEAVDKDGWLHTGDIGTWLPNGCLKIVDRKKNIFKLAQGEYVAVEKIENVYQSSPFVAQVFCEGDSLKTCLMGIIVPDSIYLEKWARNNGFPTDLKDFCQHKDAKGLILKDILDQGKKAGLKSFEQVKDIHLESEPFSIENDLLTPTMKNKRPALRKHYKKTVEDLYSKNGL